MNFSQLDVDPVHEVIWRVSGWFDLLSKTSERTTPAYSVANCPEDTGLLVHNIRLAVPPAGRENQIPPGIVSSYLFGLNSGDSIDVSRPVGQCHVPPTTPESVFVGGGVGEAPLSAMTHEQLSRGAKRRMSYYYGARSRADLFYVAEFEALAAKHSVFSWT